MEGCFVSPFPPSDHLIALRRNPDHAKSADHWPYHLCGNPGRGSHRLGDQTTPAKASSDRRDKRPCLVSVAVVATVSALVLGLLISNANTSFSALAGEVTTLSAQILRLDQMLRRYGRDTDPARETLRQYAERKTSDLFPDDPADVRLGNPSTYELLQRLEDSLLALKPANPRDQWWLGQAMTLAAKIGDTRWLLAQQVGQGTPKAFVALLVFWLTYCSPVLVCSRRPTLHQRSP